MTNETTGGSCRGQAMELVSCPWSEQHGDSGHSKLQLTDLVQGGGFFSKIYKCEDVETGKQYLVKRVQLKNLEEKDLESRLREVDIWKQLCHPNILTCHHGWQRPGPELWILSETAYDNVEMLLLSKGCAPPQALFEKWLYQLALALQYLHEGRGTPLLHRNIKPANIMVVDHYTLKLSDFGFSREMRGKDDMAFSQVGCGRTMSPEMVKNLPYDSKTDMWSLGIALVYIATLQEAVQAKTFQTLFRKTKAGQVRGIGGHYDRKAQDIINSLLQVDPKDRPSASEIVKWLRRDFRNCTRPPSFRSYPEREMVPQKNRSTAGNGSGAVAAVVHDDDVDDCDGSDGWQSNSGSIPQQELPTLTDDNRNVVIPGENRRNKSRLSNSSKPQPRNAWVSSDSGSRLPTKSTEKAGSSVPVLNSRNLFRSLDERRAEQQLDSSSTKENKKYKTTYSGRPFSSSKTAPPGGPKASKPTSPTKKHVPTLTETPEPELSIATSSAAVEPPAVVLREISEPVKFPQSSDGSDRRRSVSRLFSSRVSDLSLVILCIVADESESSSAAPSSSRSHSCRSSAEGQSRAIVEMIRSSTARPTSPSLRTPRRVSDSGPVFQTPVPGNLDRASSSELQQHSDNSDGTSNLNKKRLSDTNSSRAAMMLQQNAGAPFSAAASFREARNNERASKHASKEKTSRSLEKSTRFSDSGPEDDNDSAPVAADPFTTPEDDDVLKSSEKEEEDQLICTFPGAFNVQKRHQLAERRQHGTLHPGLPRRSARIGKTAAIDQHCSQPQEARILGAPAADDTESDADRNPRADHSSSMHVSETNWPTNLRQYWSIARNLVSKLGADDVLAALNIARLFSRTEVMMWLRERPGETDSACVDDILTLVDLNNNLDKETLLSVHQSLLHLEDAGDSSA